MRFTAKFGHLESLPDLKVGQIVKRGDKIGRMGNTGKSGGPHLHFDIMDGLISNVWRLSDINPSRDHARQSSFFIDYELFGIEPVITTYYCDPRYNDGKGKWINHPGYDIVPADRHITDDHFDISWNRSMPGQVLAVGNDSGYGYYVLIGFDA